MLMPKRRKSLMPLTVVAIAMGVALSSLTMAQGPVSVPRGCVLVDDMIMPESAIHGDFSWQPNLWPGAVRM